MQKLAQLETLFLAALDTKSPEQRAAFLDQACADQPAARRDLERMLAAHERLGDFLDQPAVALLPGNSERDLAFLQPPTKEGSLGRLAHYEILEVVGRGGCGIVLKASDERLQRIVAIKAMAFPWTSSSTARKRFIREARAAAAINHDYVVPIYAVEEEGGVPYLVMQYVAGVALEEKVRSEGALRLDEVLRIGVQIAEGLTAAHAQGIVHRDIKPGNILLEEKTGRVKITDFGLAQAVDEAGVAGERIIAGTPEYIAPEQARGESVDDRADLFSFGAVLYRLATGTSPFQGAQNLTSGGSPTGNQPAPPRQLNADVPTALSDLILRLLALDPSDRPQSAREVAEALRAIGARRPSRWLSLPIVRHLALAAAVVVALLLVAGTCFYGPAVYRLATNQGQLVIETDDADVKVVVKQDEEVVTVIDTKTQHEVTLKAGKYEVELSSSKLGLNLSARELTLKRGEQQIVRVHWLPPGPVQTLAGHEYAVWSAAFCLDGKHVISAAADGMKNGKWVRGSDCALWLWDAATGREVHRFKDHTDPIHCLAVSPDGRRAVTAGGREQKDYALRLWDLENRKLLRRFEQRHTDAIRGVAFAASGKYVLSASDDKSVRMWDAETGAEIRRFDRGETSGVWCVDISRDGKYVLSGNTKGTMRRWDANTGELLDSFQADHAGALGSVTFSPDGRYGLTQDLAAPVLWDLAAGQRAHVFRGHHGWLGRLAISPDGRRILSCGEDQTVRLWDVKTEEELARFDNHEGPVFSVAFSPDGRFAVSAGLDKTVRIWKLPP